MSAETRTDSDAERAAGTMDLVLVALGLWVLITPFFLGPGVDSGVWGLGGSWLFWSNVVAGIAIATLAGLAAYSERSA